MELIIGKDGLVRCVYGEDIPLGGIGPLEIVRASHVEPDALGQWWADMSPCNGPRLGPFGRRSEALGAEHDWLIKELLRPGAHPTATAEPQQLPNTSLQTLIDSTAA